MGAILLFVYVALGYWATGKTIYANKIIVGDMQKFFITRVIWGMLFGWVLIPVAILKTLMGR